MRKQLSAALGKNFSHNRVVAERKGKTRENILPAISKTALLCAVGAEGKRVSGGWPPGACEGAGVRGEVEGLT